LSNKMVYPVGESGVVERAGASYLKPGGHADRLEHLASARGPTGRTQVAAAMQMWIQQRRFPGGSNPFTADEQAFLASASVLMTVQEAHRTHASLTTAPMALMLAQSGTSFQSALSSFPMSGRNAPATGRALDRYLRGVSAGRTRPSRGSTEAMANTELELLRAWIAALQLDFSDLSTMAETKERLKQYIRQAILVFYGLSPVRPEPPQFQ
jgi:hypothetical protein